MNLLVGGTGFIGGHVVEYLFQQGEISKGIFRKGSHLKIMDACGVQGLEADVLDHHSLHEAMEGVDTVYSIASPMPGSDSDFRSFNTEGILNLLEVAKESKVKSFIHLSTLDVYGFGNKQVTDATRLNPSNDYQKSKVEAERLLIEFSKRDKEPRVVIVRSAKAVGSRDESLVIPILRMASSGTVTIPSSKSMSFSHPKDIAQAMYKAATGPSKAGTTYLVKSFDSTTEELCQGIVAALGASAVVKKQGFLSSSSLPGYYSAQLRASLRIGAQPSWKELGYSPAYDLKMTSEEIAAWYKKEPWVSENA
jgi:nucleoside-diphosphate-sugar epimerase